jgi:cell wall-associated NlpC family hydrolase
VAFASALARFVVLASVLVAALVLNTLPVAAAETASASQADKVVNVALNQLGDPWKHYARGPHRFDCVGLVFFAYDQNGLKDRIGGYRSPKGYFSWFKSRGLVTQDMSKAQRGDLIIWGHYKHAGIYLGDGMAVSALVNPYGVSKHKVKGYIGMGVKGFLRVNIDR